MNVLEFGGSGRLQKRKEVKKEKCKGTCVEEKKRGGKKEENVITIFLQYFHNKF